LTEPRGPEDSTEPAPDPEPPPGSSPAPDSQSPAAVAPRRIGLTTFSIAGRRAPALFVVGWLAALLGAGFVSIAMFGVTGLAGGVLWLVGLFAVAVGLVLLGGSQTVERRVAGDAYAGPTPILVFLAVLAISRLTGFVVGLPLSAIGASIPAPVGDLIAVILQALVFLGVVRLMVVGAGALGWHEMGLTRGFAEAIRGLLGGVVFAGPVILVTSVLAILAVQLVGTVPQSPLPPTGTALGLVLHLVAGAAIAPVAEEVLFRGFALTAWRRTGGARRAIVLSSVFFVLGHVLFVGGDSFRESASLAFVGGVVRVPVAFALGWLYVRTGSLWGPIGLHAAFNAILIVLGELGAGR
jgi:CAAX amino terminal protease family.